MNLVNLCIILFIYREVASIYILKWKNGKWKKCCEVSL